MQSPDLRPFEEKYDPRVITALSALLSIPGPLELTPSFLSQQSGVDQTKCLQILSELSSKGVLKRTDGYSCAVCGTFLTDEESKSSDCPNCRTAFAEKAPVAAQLFTRDVARTRDIIWVLTLHGMNTRGAWQEDLNWLISKAYRRMVPVAIYKYGIIRPGAILKFRQRALTRELIGKIRRLSGESRDAGFGAIPDVIAHSFGTWLLGHALLADPDLRVGKVILTGCILRPDFDWDSLVQKGQVEAVLCHVATRDFWARVAHYVIPDSGPSGRRGFDGDVVKHGVFEGGCHSDFFKPSLLPGIFRDVWEPFLTGQDSQSHSSIAKQPWKQAWWLFRATVLRIALLTMLGILLIILVSALALGLAELTIRVWGWCQLRIAG